MQNVTEKTTSTNRQMLLTPNGSAAVAVLRLIGPGVGGFLENHFSKPTAPPWRRLVHGTLHDADRVIDDPIVVRIDDDIADINLHGGPWVVRSAIDLAQRCGFESIDGGDDDDPRLHDAETELQREVIEWLPQARTELAIRALLAQPKAWKENRRSPQVLLDDRSLHWLLNPPRVAIVGPANAGKSTLANQLFAQERSITASVAGTTRDWVGEIANIDGLAVMLIDTPGLRETDDAIESAAIDISHRQIAAADLVLLVLDAARPMDAEQAALLSRFPNALVIINRVDLPHARDANQLDVCRTVATTGEGFDALRRAIQHHFGCADFDVSLPRTWTPRQRISISGVGPCSA